MGRKLYTRTERGVTFSSARRPGEVRIPNYVYDLWLPLLGAEAIGVYAVYCRLEREGAVKRISLRNLARACRVGTDKLKRINALLERCGFIRITRPTGKMRLMHWTTKITVLDPPRHVPSELAEELAPPSGYDPLSHWLVTDGSQPDQPQTGTPEDPGGVSGVPDQVPHKDPPGSSKIATLDLQPLKLKAAATAAATPPAEPLERQQVSHPPPPEKPLTPGQQEFLALFGARSYCNPTQAATVLALEQVHGTGKLLEMGTWAANKGMDLGRAIVAVESALKKLSGGQNGRKSGHTPANGRSSARRRPGEPVLPGVTGEQMQRKLDRLRDHGDNLDL